jgi:hypothetical protein
MADEAAIPFIERYVQAAVDRISLLREVTEDDIEKIRKIAEERAKPREVIIRNNYKDTFMEADTKRLLDLFYTKGPFMSGFGVIYKDTPNVPGKILEYLIKERKVKKKMMLAHANDADKTLHDQYDVEQKVIKVLANAYYGATGVQAFHFHNPYVGPSVTYSGQMIIMSAVLAFEAMMTANYRFESVDEILKYFYNIVSEPREEDASIGNPTRDDLFELILGKCVFDPSEEQMAVIAEAIERMDDHDVERVFFKNNLEAFLRTETITEIFGGCYDEEYQDPMGPPDSVKDNVEQLHAYADYFLFYPYQWERKDKRLQSMKRKCVLISDTDSSFLNLNPVVEWFEETFNEGERMDRKPRVAVCNVMTYLITKFVEKVFYQLTTNMQLREDRRPMINMKSEFNYARIMLTKNKKQYAGVISAQEGVYFEKPKYDLKGLSIKKVQTPKIARKRFTSILNDMILAPKKIDGIGVFHEYLAFEREISESLSEGESKFLKPAKFTSEDSYKEPFTQQVVRGVRLWNALYPRQSIQEFNNVNLVKLKKVSYDDYTKVFPESMHERIGKYFEEEGLQKYGIGILAVPKDVDALPEEMRPFINRPAIVNDIMKNGNVILESLGFKVIKSLDQAVVSNLIEV